MSEWTQAAPGRWNARACGRSLAVVVGVVLLVGAAKAQVSVTESGTPSYSQAIAVPPGIAGMAPNIGLLYSGGGVNGPLGYSWTLQGISTITRCPAIKATDGAPRGVEYTASDKLCLDGQRLIQTDAAGTAAAFPQTNDSLGGSGMVREYRTEKDSFARIRAYGTAGASAANGPAYFKVWTKSGQIYEYGNNSNSTANSAIAVQGKTVISAWAVSRISDTLGNYIDFQYEQRNVAWGSGPTAGSPTPGHEWNLVEIRYTGRTGQQPTNRVRFDYSDRPDSAGAAQDRSEAYHQGAKRVSIWRLDAVRTYTNWPGNVSAWPATPPGTAVKVKAVKLTYDQGPVTKRSRLTKIQECTREDESACLPPATFTYSSGAGENFSLNTGFNLQAEVLMSSAGTHGVLTGDFNGDGITDLLRWSDTPADNKLWLGGKTGAFAAVPNGTGAGQFNLTGTTLFKSNQCFYSIAADFNADGLTDILRLMRDTSSSSASCGTLAHRLLLSDGDGSFTSKVVTGIDFSQIESERTEQYNCQQPYSTGYVPGCAERGDTYLGTSQTTGRNFHILDVDGDGILDIVTSMLPGFVRTMTPPTPDSTCAALVCTQVFLGSSTGVFSEATNVNVVNRSLYAAPPKTKFNSYWQRPYVLDANGDGLSDIVAATGTWISQSNGNFVKTAAPYSSACQHAIDTNGDGRQDCLLLTYFGAASQRLVMPEAGIEVADFNLKSVGQELLTFADSSANSVTAGIQVLDGFDGSRGAILRWKDDPAANTIYLSNGDGTFRESAGFNLKTAAKALRHSDGSSDFVLGDFTGRGQIEIIRLKNGANSSSEASGNQLYARSASQPDLLTSHRSSTGIATTFTYAPLTNSDSGSLGDRYQSDRATVNAANHPVMDLSVPMQVVVTTETDTGVGTTKSRTEYSYAGLKMGFDGRGLRGFRETRRQSPAPNGSDLTTVTTYQQGFPYAGVAAQTDTYLGALNSLPANPLSRSSYTYCEKSAPAAAECTATPVVPGAECTATPAAACAVPAATRIYRPYLYRSVEQGWDLGGTTLPTVTTANAFNNTGDPTSIIVTTKGDAVGLSQTVTKTTSNQYASPATSGDDWILGRLQRSSVQSSVPNQLGSIAASPGGAALANAVQGVIPTASLSSIAFADTRVSSTRNANATLTNNTAVPIWVTAPSAASVTGSRFSFVSTSCTESLAAGASCTVTVRFAPIAVGAASGTLTVDTGAGTKAASLSGDGVQGNASASPSSLTLATTPVGSTSAAQTVTVTNTGDYALVVSSATASGDFDVSANTCSTLAVNGTCTISVRFSPSVVGARTGTLTIANDGSSGARSVALTGTGTQGNASLSASSLALGSIYPLGTTTAKSVTITNTGTSALSISSAAATGDFEVSSNNCTTLAVNATCSIAVTLTPTALGTRNGTLTIANNGSSGNKTVSLSGTGAGAWLSVSPDPLGFGSRAKDTLTTLPVTVTNIGNASASGLSFGVTNGAGTPIYGMFAATTGGTCVSGGSLAAGASCTFRVNFTSGCSGGSVSGTYRVQGSNFALFSGGLTGGTSFSGICP